MKLIVGLGNPGEKYARTRHNVGFMVIDELATRIQKGAGVPTLSTKFKNQNYNLKFKNDKRLQSETLELGNVVLAKPTSFMNASGIAVKKLIENWKLKIENLYVIHDDLDLPIGSWKMQLAKGPKVHGGINSIEQEIGSVNFTRMRVGVDQRNSETRTAGEEYVLQEFPQEELEIVSRVVQEVTQEILKKVLEKKL